MRIIRIFSTSSTIQAILSFHNNKSTQYLIYRPPSNNKSNQNLQSKSPINIPLEQLAYRVFMVELAFIVFLNEYKYM